MRGLSIWVFALAITAASASAESDEKVLLAFGDSLTQGYGLARGAGFVPALEAWLRETGARVRVINAGVSGDTTAGGAARIGWNLTPEVDAVIVALGANDMLRGQPPAAAKENLRAILSEIRARALPVLLVGVAAPMNFGAAYKAEFDAVYRDLAREFAIPLYPDFLAPLSAISDPRTVLESYMQADAIHPNAAGVRLIVEAIGPEIVRLLQAPG